MRKQVKETILLTGAGLTKNFGGLLASEIWAEILNNPLIHQYENVIKLLRTTFDYEEVYHHIITGESYTNKEKEAISNAVADAYIKQEEILSNWSNRPGSAYPLNIHDFRIELIANFAGDERGKGFIFTLNQDLLLERHAYNNPHPHLPGIPNRSEWFSSSLAHTKPQQIGFIDVAPNNYVFPLELCQDSSYVKLHGAVNLRYLGSDLIVIGNQKTQTINSQPLLSAYFQLFKDVLSLPSRRLLVIGYGFNDIHINEIIAKNVKDVGLKIYILNPTLPQQLHDHILNQTYGQDIWDGLCGYFQNTLEQLFPQSQDKTPVWQHIKKIYFG